MLELHDYDDEVVGAAIIVLEDIIEVDELDDLEQDDEMDANE